MTTYLNVVIIIKVLKVGWWIQTFRLLGPVSRKSWERFGPGNLFCVRHVPIHDQSFFNNFENDAIKLSVNKKIDWFVC